MWQSSARKIVTGPLVGRVEDRSAQMVLEVDVAGEILLKVSSEEDGLLFSMRQSFERLRARVCVLSDLVPGVHYVVTFSGVRKEDQERRAEFTTTTTAAGGRGKRRSSVGFAVVEGPQEPLFGVAPQLVLYVAPLVCVERVLERCEREKRRVLSETVSTFAEGGQWEALEEDHWERLRHEYRRSFGLRKALANGPHYLPPFSDERAEAAVGSEKNSARSLLEACVSESLERMLRGVDADYVSQHWDDDASGRLASEKRFIRRRADVVAARLRVARLCSSPRPTHTKEEDPPVFSWRPEKDSRTTLSKKSDTLCRHYGVGSVSFVVFHGLPTATTDFETLLGNSTFLILLVTRHKHEKILVAQLSALLLAQRKNKEKRSHDKNQQVLLVAADDTLPEGFEKVAYQQDGRIAFRHLSLGQNQKKHGRADHHDNREEIKSNGHSSYRRVSLRPITMLEGLALLPAARGGKEPEIRIRLLEEEDSSSGGGASSSSRGGGEKTGRVEL